MATINGVEVIIYEYFIDDQGRAMCRCKVPCANTLIPVLANLIEVQNEQI